ncbi:hypothetical protein [Paraburkholderia sp. BCC1884]|uniref:hypothetical protein n=1 Tax=Paraburkholderia sp. BCC1884 TaxID=2562668 RepID=UPI0011832FC7|nr:hypothetical protein [Paraburkholderia sp. BCC1884]
MKRTNQIASNAEATKSAEPLVDADAINELNELLSQRRKLDDAVDEAPGQIAAAERELSGLRADLAAREADVVFVDDSKLAALQKEIAKLADAVDAKDLAVRRLKARVEALEARAPELDSKIDLAIGFVRVDANMAAQDVQAELAEELRSAVAKAQVIYAKVRALQRLVPMDRTSDFLISAYVPDLESCMRVNTGTGHYDAAPNLLAAATDETKAAEAELAELMKPITDAVHAGRKHRPYVPLSRRQPYIIKGSNEGIGGKPEAPPVRVVEQPAFKGYRIDGEYQVKGDQSGVRTRQAAATEMDMGRAIMHAADSARQ